MKKERLMKVYVASSWRNNEQPAVVERLREEGFEVYDFKNNDNRGADFHWRDIDPKWADWSPEDAASALNHSIAQHAFDVDMSNLEWCDALVYVQPCGVSASLELGWAVGSGRPSIVLMRDGDPELMLKMATIVTSIDAVVAELNKHRS
jgi:hypothetical protein